LGWKFNDVDIDLLDDGHPTCAMNAKDLVELLQREAGPRLHEKPGWFRRGDRYATR
jgi:hypothetical protein